MLDSTGCMPGVARARCAPQRSIPDGPHARLLVSPLWTGKGHTVAVTVLHELEPSLGAAADDDRFTKGKFA